MGSEMCIRDRSSALADVVLVSESVVALVDGKKKPKKKNLSYLFLSIPEFNSYVKDILSDVEGVYGFVGVGGWGREQEPVPIPYREIENMLKCLSGGEGSTLVEAALYEEGDMVEIVDGAFQGTVATVKRVFPARKRIEVFVKMFNNLTPVEFAYSQVKRR